jgi:Flp pilus assembly protein CpaB
MARLQEMAMSGGSRGLLLLALLAGLVAAIIVFVIVSESDSGGGEAGGGGETPAVVASQDISAGAEITEDMITVTDVPDDLLVSGSLEDTELVVGETARVAIASGEQVTTSKLGVPVPDAGISGVIPVGMRGVAIEVDQVTAVGGLLLPGDRVDIVRTVKIKDPAVAGVNDNTYILRTETVLQNVEVLSVAQEAQEASAQAPADAETDPSSTSGQLPDDVEEQPNAVTITVALDSGQSQLVVGSQDSEAVVRVWAIQRAFGDSAIVDVPPFEERIVE